MHPLLLSSVRAREALRACLPEPLRDNTFGALLKVGGYESFRRRFSPRARREIWLRRDALPPS